MTKPLQYCKVTSLQLIKINEKKNNAKELNTSNMFKIHEFIMVETTNSVVSLNP